MEQFMEDVARQLDELPPEDPIHECGASSIQALRDDAGAALKEADANLRVFPFKDVRACWRRLFTDASVRLALQTVRGALSTTASLGPDDGGPGAARVTEESLKGTGAKRAASPLDDDVAGDVNDDPPWLTETVRLLDMALIMTGGRGREELIETFFRELELDIEDQNKVQNPSHPARKRIKRSTDLAKNLPIMFPIGSLRTPEIQYPVKRCEMTFSAFQNHLDSPSPTPLVLQGVINHWSPGRRHMWCSPGYLLQKTFGGRRLVPVELGRSYTDEDWGQKIMPFRRFMEDYLLIDTSEPSSHDKNTQVGIAYLAQHDLFAQIPALRRDIAIPDLCYTDPPDASPDSADHISETNKLEQPLINAWFGPAGTISPLHTDPYHNILTQVVGKKYVRLYAPSETKNLEPRAKENGVDMSNTSAIPVEVVEMGALGVDDAEEDRWDKFENAKYVETILSDTESLYIPTGWWHYVRSLSVSCSVSFWWN